MIAEQLQHELDQLESENSALRDQAVHMPVEQFVDSVTYTLSHGTKIEAQLLSRMALLGLMELQRDRKAPNRIERMYVFADSFRDLRKRFDLYQNEA